MPLDSLPAIPLPGSSQGASFILAVDTSGSVKGDPMDGIKASAVEFISLMGPKDKVGLMTFDDKTRLINPITSKKEVLKHMISRLRTVGQLTVLKTHC
jgi:Mg-chelatase subunit ChlD